MGNCNSTQEKGLCCTCVVATYHVLGEEHHHGQGVGDTCTYDECFGLVFSVGVRLWCIKVTLKIMPAYLNLDYVSSLNYHMHVILI